MKKQKVNEGVSRRKASGSPYASSSPKTAERPATGSRAPFQPGDVVVWVNATLSLPTVMDRMPVRVHECHESSSCATGWAVGVIGLKSKRKTPLAIWRGWDSSWFRLASALGIGAGSPEPKVRTTSGKLGGTSPQRPKAKK